MNLRLLYQRAVLHQQEHRCSAHPYQEYERLAEIVFEHQPKRILEIGTGCGFTAVVMAQQALLAKIDSIEKDIEHAELARKFIADCVVSATASPATAGSRARPEITNSHITIHNKVAEEFLPTLARFYDLIFFDGYQIHFEFLSHYERLLKSGGVLVLGNNHLTSKTSDQFFDGLRNPERWKILDQFADTIVAQRI